MLKILKVFYLFSELNDDDIDWIVATGELERITKGSVLIEQGLPIDSFYILLEGKVSVYIAVNKKETKKVAELGSGEVFGEMSFVDTGLPSASVEAVEESIVLSIARHKLANRLYQDVGFASRFYRAISIFMSSRLRATVQDMSSQDKSSVQQEGDKDKNTEMFDNFTLAKARYDWLVRRLKNLMV